MACSILYSLEGSYIAAVLLVKFYISYLHRWDITSFNMVSYALYAKRHMRVPYIDIGEVEGLWALPL